MSAFELKLDSIDSEGEMRTCSSFANLVRVFSSSDLNSFVLCFFPNPISSPASTSTYLPRFTSSGNLR